MDAFDQAFQALTQSQVDAAGEGTHTLADGTTVTTNTGDDANVVRPLPDAAPPPAAGRPADDGLYHPPVAAGPRVISQDAGGNAVRGADPFDQAAARMQLAGAMERGE